MKGFRPGILVIIFLPLISLSQLNPHSNNKEEPLMTSGSAVANNSGVNVTYDKNPSAAVSRNDIENELTSAEQITAYKKGLNLYNKGSYLDAIPYFKKLVRPDSGNFSILSRLGDCYRITGDQNGQLACYGNLIRTARATPLQELYYAQALLTLGQKELAKKYFDKYDVQDDIQHLETTFGKNKMFRRNSDAYSVTFSPLNSEQNDICATKYFDATIFASARGYKKATVSPSLKESAYMNVYTAGKDKTGAEKVPVKFLKELNTKYNDGPVSFSRDYDLMFYTTNCARKSEKAKDGTFKMRIMEAELSKEMVEGVRLPGFNNKEYNYAYPSVSEDGQSLYFCSDQPGGKGGMDLYVCRRDASGNWGEAVNLQDLNTPKDEMFPFISAKGTLYFSSDGHEGLGGLDIFEASFKTGKPTQIYNMGEPVNSPFDDLGYYISPDNKTGFITSNRKKNGADHDIFELKVLREITRGKDVLMAFKDKKTNAPAPNVCILLNRDTVYTNEKGQLITIIPEHGYLTVRTLKDDYFEFRDSLAPSDYTANSLVKEILIEKNPKLFLRALITDARSNELMEGVTMKITDLSSNKNIDIYTTTTGGDYFKFLSDKRLGDELNYEISLRKTGYLSRTLVFKHLIDKPGEVNLNGTLDLKLGKIEEGMELTKMSDVRSIRFENNKTEIPTEGFRELDKVIEIMNEYPNIMVQVCSHTDCRNSAITNMGLSSSRAKLMADYIVKKGINRTRISARGYGESNLLNNCSCEGENKSNCPEEEHGKNNRTEFVITGLK